jgi:hypothetical protein
VKRVTTLLAVSFDRAKHRSIFHERVQREATKSEDVNTQERQRIAGGDPLPNRADNNGWDERQSGANSKDAPSMVQKGQDHDEADVEPSQSRDTDDELKGFSQQAAKESRRGRSGGTRPPIRVGNILRTAFGRNFYLLSSA